MAQGYHIAIDLCHMDDLDGDGRYQRALITELLKINSSHRFTVMVPRYKSEIDCRCVKQIVIPSRTIFKTKLYYFFELENLLYRQNIDLCHLTWSFGFLYHRFSTISTVFDLTSLYSPHLRESRWLHYQYKYLLPFLLKKTNLIVTASNTSQKKIQKAYQLPKNKIKVIYLGVQDDYFKPGKKEELLTAGQQSIKKGYILFVGYLTPKKNLPVVLKALHLLREKYQLVFTLVMAGEKGFGYHSAEELILKYHLSDSVIQLGYINNKDLRLLYQNAFVLVYPTLNEGFGLVPVEAMACGCPVIHSDIEVLNEVSGGCALNFSPNDADELAGQIRRLYNDQPFYENLVIQGMNRAKRFRWADTARQYLEMYETTIKSQKERR